MNLIEKVVAAIDNLAVTKDNLQASNDLQGPTGLASFKFGVSNFARDHLGNFIPLLTLGF